jgi:hypothetical protein
MSLKDRAKATANNIESEIQEKDQEGTELYDYPTPDSYDPHMVPAETAARKEREGSNFKHLIEHPAGADSLDTTGGFTVDREGLVDNFGVEPEMYYHTHGDLLNKVGNKPEKLDM